MTVKELDRWFKDLDTNDLSFLFPFLYEQIMESADPDVSVNDFYKEAKALWRAMTKEEKQELHNSIINH